MGFVVLAGGSPVGSAQGLPEAMRLAEQHVDAGCSVEIVTRSASELRTWRFDHDRQAWLGLLLKRRAPLPGALSADLPFAA